ncbi:hypothetical protein A2V82_16340 [candidate division KSB1 bacterium RBG_16_48_16]|nr:MAG: hypothetical protein A2V82_16340 [candidate division KSB1 bacterium RBG_16_48_16]
MDIINMPNYPERWLIPIKEIRQHLKGVRIKDWDRKKNVIIERELESKEINKLILHWKDMVMYGKQHFKNAFTPGIMCDRPYLIVSAVKDSHICDFCKVFHHKVIRSGEPYAAQFFPPFHLGCRCTMYTLSERELKRDKLVESWPDIELPDLFQAPVCIL